MARVINHNTPGKRRSQQMRTIAEINKMTRKESDWAGAYRRLMDEREPE